ncbi:hypothetical protein [Streptomyces sp. NPDC059850]|uniref:hypothetical protein n=1 Tax=Streptomyces sp. NPDC059850 TaxID=3346970 RepID=UPI003657FCB2
MLLVVGGVAALGVAAFLADRVLLWMERRGWIYWCKRKTLLSIGSDFVQEVDPGARVLRQGMEQERVRKNVRPAEGPPPVQLDLDTGVVRFRRTGRDGRDGHDS